LCKSITILLLSSITLLLAAPVSAQRALSPEMIGKLVPSRIKGYYQNGTGKNSMITLGTIRYSIAERSFRSRTRTVKFLLFDYAEAPIMFNQAVRKWGEMKTISTDSLVYQPLAGTDSSAWESWSGKSQMAQIILGINKRFFVNVSSEKIPLEELRQLVQLMPFEKFPR
jgi:hypothetical protein